MFKTLPLKRWLSCGEESRTGSTDRGEEWHSKPLALQNRPECTLDDSALVITRPQ